MALPLSVLSNVTIFERITFDDYFVQVFSWLTSRISVKLGLKLWQQMAHRCKQCAVAHCVCKTVAMSTCEKSELIGSYLWLPLVNFEHLQLLLLFYLRELDLKLRFFYNYYVVTSNIAVNMTKVEIVFTR